MLFFSIVGRNKRNRIVYSYCNCIFQWLLLIVKILCKIIKTQIAILCKLSNGWLLSLNIIYAFLKCSLTFYDKSGSAVREYAYLSICNAMDGATEFTHVREGGYVS